MRLLVLFLATANAFILLYAPQPLLPIWKNEFQLSISAVSHTISITIITLAITSFMLASKFDLYNRKKIILLASIALIIPSAMIAVSDSFTTILFWRFAYGLFIPGVTAVMMAYASEEFPAKHRGKIMGIYVSANVGGGLLGRVISGPIADLFSWKAVFGCMAALSAVVAFLVWIYLPNPKNQTKKNNDSALIHFKNPTLVGTFAIGFAQFFAFISFFTYIPFYVSGAPFHLTVTEVSLLYLTYAFGLLSAPISGYISDKIGRRWTMANGHIIAVIGILLTLFGTLPTIIIGASLLAFGNFASQSATTAFVTDIATTSRGAATSLYLFFFYLGGSLGSWIPGIIWDEFAWNGVVLSTTGTICIALMINASLTKKSSSQQNISA
ncbi:MFS transporter [Siminovitchia sp. FSL H7-0308]|uniref:YNFM family putative membrane transporter n=1 Tax=Siminovitchia thermophila TaxID=1245522 RepID=A0ABS2R202_9BACI|nr:MFS transporter [Siminovitchia thermophila]MBM7713420.1 YNFM family putative membrane transporter [Siminovitchia thermophila]ONK21144.1 MFS transporter [Bacillus sp. VT-16-64]